MLRKNVNVKILETQLLRVSETQPLRKKIKRRSWIKFGNAFFQNIKTKFN